MSPLWKQSSTCSVAVVVTLLCLLLFTSRLDTSPVSVVGERGVLSPRAVDVVSASTQTEDDAKPSQTAAAHGDPVGTPRVTIVTTLSQPPSLETAATTLATTMATTATESATATPVATVAPTMVATPTPSPRSVVRMALQANGRLGYFADYFMFLDALSYFSPLTQYDAFFMYSVSDMTTARSLREYRRMLSTKGNRLLVFDDVENVLTTVEKARRNWLIQRRDELVGVESARTGIPFENRRGPYDGIPQYYHRWVLNQRRRETGNTYHVIVRARCDLVVISPSLRSSEYFVTQIVPDIAAEAKNIYMQRNDFLGISKPRGIDIETSLGNDPNFTISFYTRVLELLGPNATEADAQARSVSLVTETRRVWQFNVDSQLAPLMRYHNFTFRDAHEVVHFSRAGRKWRSSRAKSHRLASLDALWLRHLFNITNETPRSFALASCTSFRAALSATANLSSRVEQSVAAFRADALRRFPAQGLEPLYSEWTLTPDSYDPGLALDVTTVAEPLSLPLFGNLEACDACEDALRSRTAGNSTASAAALDRCRASLQDTQSFLAPFDQGVLDLAKAAATHGDGAFIVQLRNKDDLPPVADYIDIFERQGIGYHRRDYTVANEGALDDELRPLFDHIRGAPDSRTFQLVVLDNVRYDATVRVLEELLNHDNIIRNHAAVVMIRAPVLDVEWWLDDGADMSRLRLLARIHQCAMELRLKGVVAHVNRRPVG